MALRATAATATATAPHRNPRSADCGRLRWEPRRAGGVAAGSAAHPCADDPARTSLSAPATPPAHRVFVGLSGRVSALHVCRSRFIGDPTPSARTTPWRSNAPVAHEDGLLQEAQWPLIGFRVVGADSSATRGRRHERRFGGQMPRSPMRMGSYEKHGGFQSVVACLSLADGVAAPQVARGRRIPARRRPVGQGAYGVPRIRPVPGLDRPGCARARVQRRGRPSSGGAIFGVRAASGSTRGSGASVTAPAAAPPSARRWPPRLPGWTDRPAPGLRGPVRCHGRPPRAGRAGPGSRSPRARSRCT